MVCSARLGSTGSTFAFFHLRFQYPGARTVPQPTQAVVVVDVPDRLHRVGEARFGVLERDAGPNDGLVDALDQRADHEGRDHGRPYVRDAQGFPHLVPAEIRTPEDGRPGPRHTGDHPHHSLVRRRECVDVRRNGGRNLPQKGVSQNADRAAAAPTDAGRRGDGETALCHGRRTPQGIVDAGRSGGRREVFPGVVLGGRSPSHRVMLLWYHGAVAVLYFYRVMVCCVVV